MQRETIQKMNYTPEEKVQIIRECDLKIAALNKETKRLEDALQALQQKRKERHMLNAEMKSPNFYAPQQNTEQTAKLKDPLRTLQQNTDSAQHKPSLTRKEELEYLAAQKREERHMLEVEMKSPNFYTPRQNTAEQRGGLPNWLSCSTNWFSEKVAPLVTKPSTEGKKALTEDSELLIKKEL